MKRTHARFRRQSIDAAILYRDATNSITFPTPFPNTRTRRGLEQSARAIAAREELGRTRQIIFVERGGWDHHDDLLGRQNVMLPEVSEALQAFGDAMVHLGVQDDMVLHSISDFARTLNSNGRGSDHAWGGNHCVMGGLITCGRLYGNYPETLAPGNELDLGHGRLIPTTSTDEYSAELAMWFGIGNDGDLEEVLPNIRNFYASSATARPLGMFR